MTQTPLHTAFYRFSDLDPVSLPALKSELLGFFRELKLYGTLLLAREGINGMLWGEPQSVARAQARIRAISGMEDLRFRDTPVQERPFARLLVKIKRAIIPLDGLSRSPATGTGERLAPETLKAWLDQGKPVTLLDTRNDYEIKEGTFKNTLDLGIGKFRHFGKALATDLPKLAEKSEQGPIVMFCTGGIRCEKATALAQDLGLRNVYQLEGGILSYFEKCGNAHYDGTCLVFDGRDSVSAD